MATTGDLTWTGPTSVRQCEQTLLTWSGGSGPFSLRVTPTDRDGSSLVGASRQLGPAGIPGRSYSWLVDYPAGTQLRISVLPSLARYYPTVTVNVLSGSDDCTLYGSGRSPVTRSSTTTRISSTPAITRISTSPPRSSTTSTTPATTTIEVPALSDDTSTDEVQQPSSTRGDITSSVFDQLKQTEITSWDRTSAASSTGQPSGVSPPGLSDGGTTGIPGDNVGGEGGNGGGSGSLDIGAIVGGVVGGVLGLALIAALLYAWLHARRRRQNEPTTTLDIDEESAVVVDPTTYPVTPYTPTATASSERTGAPEESPLLTTKEAPAPPGQEEEFAIDAGPVREQRPPQYDPNWSREQPKAI